MSSLVVIAIICAIVWFVWSTAIRQLRLRQHNSSDNPDIVAWLKADERAYNRAAIWAIVAATIGSFFGIAGFGSAISGIIPGAILGWVLGRLSAKAAG
jgi:uncharacterized membrane protein